MSTENSFKLSGTQRMRIIDRHRDSLLRFGRSPAALYWSSRKIQEIRFKVLCDIGIEAGNSVLDVGCGFADLKAWIERYRFPICYTGIDLSPELLEVAISEHPDAEFVCGDIFDLKARPRGFDWVILSGTLNEMLEDGGRYARAVIAQMFWMAQRGVAFNLLNIRHRVLLGFGLQHFDPVEMITYCRSLTPDCELRTDYLDNDFTVLMYRHRQ